MNTPRLFGTVHEFWLYTKSKIKLNNTNEILLLFVKVQHYRRDNDRNDRGDYDRRDYNRRDNDRRDYDRRDYDRRDNDRREGDRYNGGSR